MSSGSFKINIPVIIDDEGHKHSAGGACGVRDWREARRRAKCVISRIQFGFTTLEEFRKDYHKAAGEK